MPDEHGGVPIWTTYSEMDSQGIWPRKPTGRFAAHLVFGVEWTFENINPPGFHGDQGPESPRHTRKRRVLDFDYNGSHGGAWCAGGDSGPFAAVRE